MKVVVFAHTPPPHHGQSYMVQLMLEGFGGDRRKSISAKAASAKSPRRDFGIDCYHVNCRVSRRLEEIGEFRPVKFFLLVRYCAQAIWFRLRYGVTNFYYVPAPGKRSALYRDWLVMFLCRPFFKKIILHWHAAGMAKWLETCVQIRTRSLTFRLMKYADLSVVLASCSGGDAEKLLPRRIKVIDYGIPDACPNFSTAVLPRRQARLATRRELLVKQALQSADLENAGADADVFRVLYIGHCTRDKGLFDALDGVRLANEQLTKSGSLLRVHLTIAGGFLHASEQAEFEQRIGRSVVGLALEDSGKRADGNAQSCFTYAGFVSGATKERLFIESDCLCFPTYYYAESFGLVVIEAMSFGLEIVASRWRALPEILPADYPGLVDVRAPDQIAEALLRLADSSTGSAFRDTFLQRFTLEKYLTVLADALKSVEQTGSVSGNAISSVTFSRHRPAQ